MFESFEALRRTEHHEVRVTCLGQFNVQLHRTQVASWSAGRSKALFQRLVCAEGRTVAKGALVEALWTDEGTEPSSSSLKVAAHGVRATLRRACQDCRDLPPCSLEFVSGAYQLRLSDVWVDVHEFERHLEHYHARGGDESGLWDLRAAVGLYTGDFLPAETALWVQERREWYRSQALQALSVLRAHAARRGECDDVRRLCRQTLRIDACNEGAYRGLMHLHSEEGELSEALRWFDMCRAQLAGKLGVLPSDATTSLARRLFARPSGPNPAHPVGRQRGEVRAGTRVERPAADALAGSSASVDTR